MQTLHLTQPDNHRLLRGTGALWADVCVGSSLCRPATRRPRHLPSAQSPSVAHARLDQSFPRCRFDTAATGSL